MPAPGSASGLFYGCHSSSEFLRREAPEAAWAARLARLEAAVRRKARGRRQSPRMRRIMARTVQMHAQEMQQQQQLRRGDGSGQHGGEGGGGRMSTGGGGNGEGCGAKRMRTDGGGRGGDGGGEGGGSWSEAGEVSMPGKSRRVAGGPVRPGPPTQGPQGPQGPRTEQPLEKARCEQRGRERDGFHGRPGLGSGHPGHQPAARQRKLGAAMEADSSSKQRVRVRSKRKSRARSSSRVPEHCGAPSARRVQHTPPWASTNSTVTTATATSTDNNNNDDNRCSPLSGGDVSTAAVPGQVHLTTSTSSNDVSSQPRAGPLPGAERAGSRTHPGGACPRPAATAPPPHKLVAIDCEMVGLGPGGCRGALARCSVVDYHGSVLYDSYVRPEEPVTDYRTRWSGVRPAHMRDATPFRAAQTEIVRLLHNKVVVGHSIANDFRALSYVHPVERTRDTAALLELRRRAGLPMAQPASLKRLTKLLLYRDIQVGRHGHSSVEDARATMELYRLVEAQLGGSGGPA